MGASQAEFEFKKIMLNEACPIYIFIFLWSCLMSKWTSKSHTVLSHRDKIIEAKRTVAQSPHIGW